MIKPTMKGGKSFILKQHAMTSRVAGEILLKEHDVPGGHKPNTRSYCPKCKTYTNKKGKRK